MDPHIKRNSRIRLEIIENKIKNEKNIIKELKINSNESKNAEIKRNNSKKEIERFQYLNINNKNKMYSNKIDNKERKRAYINNLLKTQPYFKIKSRNVNFLLAIIVLFVCIFLFDFK